MTVEDFIVRGTVSIITIDLIARILKRMATFADDYEGFGRWAAKKYRRHDVGPDEVVRICYSLRQLYSVRGREGLIEFREEMQEALAQPAFPMPVMKN